MSKSFIVKAAPGSVTPIYAEDDQGNPTTKIVGYSYPDALAVTRDMQYNDGADWDVWLMIANDSEDEPFTAQSGDTILAGWEPFTGEVLAWHPIHPDLFDYVQPIGNELNEDTGAHDGTAYFPVHSGYFGHAKRFWGTVNPYPDANQARHVTAFRFQTEWAGQTYYQVGFRLSEPFDKDNPPNALAILLFTQPERNYPGDYWYTPGAFVWTLIDAETDTYAWHCETPLGQSPTTGPADTHYCVALGSSPLPGGTTLAADEDEKTSYHWDQDLT
jgi:hypothetical protein